MLQNGRQRGRVEIKGKKTVKDRESKGRGPYAWRKWMALASSITVTD